jgi:hypothetical protein
MCDRSQRQVWHAAKAPRHVHWKVSSLALTDMVPRFRPAHRSVGRCVEVKTMLVPSA